jgi:hypothetical protein
MKKSDLTEEQLEKYDTVATTMANEICENFGEEDGTVDTLLAVITLVTALGTISRIAHDGDLLRAEKAIHRKIERYFELLKVKLN